jgi:radical SAM superfamily enzyme with C-terminal helix-hairpin-helix motif
MRFFYSRAPDTNSIILGIQFYQTCHYSRLAFCSFCALPSLVAISLRAHRLVAVALFMF